MCQTALAAVPSIFPAVCRVPQRRVDVAPVTLAEAAVGPMTLCQEMAMVA